ncbi:MAG: GT-D fold domain-containing protein [Clostridiales bacterium]|nr:GT-D fold domain-containing protein [Clostridiales bacterium]
MASGYKNKIIKLLPDRLVYLLYAAKQIPAYLKALIENKKSSFPIISFYSDEETVDKIVNERKSLSRFGDGEIRWMLGVSLDSFQVYSDAFAADLRSAFQSENPNLLIGLPVEIVDSSKCNINAKMHWEIIKKDFYGNLMKLADLKRTYCNASITRPYIDYHSREYSRRCFENLKRVWNNRDVIFVEGKKTKLGCGNDLFANAKSIKRIICPAENAYEKIDLIKKAIIKNADKENNLILCALGPTASILSAQMCDLGYQIIDIGHIDIEYWWYNNKSILRDEVPGKYVNESGVKTCSDFFDNDLYYLDSVIADVT